MSTLILASTAVAEELSQPVRQDEVGAFMRNEAEREDGVPAIADYETFDHTPVRIIVLTVAPKNYNAPYLQLMASLSRILHASSAYRRLLMCTSAESMKDFFSSKQKEKTT